MFVIVQYVNKFLVRNKKYWTSTKHFGTCKRTRHKRLPAAALSLFFCEIDEQFVQQSFSISLLRFYSMLNFYVQCNSFQNITRFFCAASTVIQNFRLTSLIKQDGDLFHDKQRLLFFEIDAKVFYFCHGLTCFYCSAIVHILFEFTPIVQLMS